MSLQQRFLLFSTVMLTVLSVAGWVVLSGRAEQRARRRSIEVDWSETNLTMELQREVDKLRHAVTSAALHKQPLPAWAVRQPAALLHTLSQLEIQVRRETGAHEPETAELVAISQLRDTFRQLQPAIDAIPAGLPAPDPAEVDAIDALCGDALAAIAGFRESLSHEVGESLKSLRDQEARLQQAVKGGILAVAVTLLVAWVILAVGLVRPLQRVTAMVSRMKDRAFPMSDEARIPGGELGELMRTFLDMARSIESLTAGLEAKVSARTAELEASRSQLRFVFDGLPDAVALLDDSGRVLVANSAYVALFGGGVQPPDREALERTPQGYRRLRTPDGRSLLLDCHRLAGSRLGGGPGEVVLEYAREVTRIGQAEAALAALQRMAAMERLASSVAHEINNPLTAIAACAEGLAERVEACAIETAELREDAQILLHEAYRCKAITDKLLSIGRDQRIRVEPVRLGDLVRDCILLRERTNTRRGVVVALATEGDDTVWASEEAVRQILLNLLQNAAAACREGGRIDVRLAGSPDGVRVEVRDTGSGIAPEHLPHLFEPFFTQREQGDGTGLGLFICQGLAQAMGSQIEAASDGPGCGAVFSFTLPRPEPESRVLAAAAADAAGVSG